MKEGPEPTTGRFVEAGFRTFTISPAVDLQSKVWLATSQRGCCGRKQPNKGYPEKRMPHRLPPVFERVTWQVVGCREVLSYWHAGYRTSPPLARHRGLVLIRADEHHDLAVPNTRN